MRVHVLTVGAEVLAGDILDTNFRELAVLLREDGLSVTGHSTCPDDPRRIAAHVRAGWEEAEGVLVTGGLGPTPDDVTREGIADALGVPQERREDLVPDLEEIFRRFGHTGPLPGVNFRQLDLPRGAEALPNPAGTAPGFLAWRDDRWVAAVPGIPTEMRRMVHEQILPRLRGHYGLPVIRRRLLRTQGIGESDLVERLGDVPDGWRGVGIAYYPQQPGVDIKLVHLGKDRKRIDERLEAAAADVRRILGDRVYGEEGDTLPGVVGDLLLARGWRAGVAESCTGGAVAALLTSVPGASRWFDRGVVAYANRAKTELLGVAEALLDEHGAVSEPVARAMAEGMRARHGVDVAVATTGIAGPDGGTDDKPVGLVYTAVATPAGTVCRETRSPGTRAHVVRRTAVNAVNLLRLSLLREPS